MYYVVLYSDAFPIQYCLLISKHIKYAVSFSDRNIKNAYFLITKYYLN